MRHCKLASKLKQTGFIGVLLFVVGGACLFTPSQGLSHTANKVWYEFHPHFYRIFVRYTIPALKEFREASIDVRDRKKAEQIFWGLVRGADFYIHSDQIVFINHNKRTPW